jgi:hypothetical protein
VDLLSQGSLCTIFAGANCKQGARWISFHKGAYEASLQAQFASRVQVGSPVTRVPMKHLCRRKLQGARWVSYHKGPCEASLQAQIASKVQGGSPITRVLTQHLLTAKIVTGHEPTQYLLSHGSLCSISCHMGPYAASPVTWVPMQYLLTAKIVSIQEPGMLGPGLRHVQADSPPQMQEQFCSQVPVGGHDQGKVRSSHIRGCAGPFRGADRAGKSAY